MDVDVIGLNCATGPVRDVRAAAPPDRPRRRSRCRACPTPACRRWSTAPCTTTSTPHQLAEYHRQFVTELGVSVVGGCCGTTPEHLAAVVDACADLTPAARSPEPEEGAASIYTHVPFTQDSSFLVVGERTNANGSKKFREAMLEADWDTCVAMAKEQVKEGSHLIDVCVDYTGADGVADMERGGLAASPPSPPRPLMVDSTEAPVVETALSLDRRPGRHQLGQPRGGRRPRAPGSTRS